MAGEKIVTSKVGATFLKSLINKPNAELY